MWRKRLGIACVILTVAWMGVIFWMSAKPADESSDMSLSVGYAIGSVIVENFENLPAPEQYAYAEQIDHPVRKSAHFSEYTVLGIFLSADLLLLCLSVPGAAREAMAWGIGTLYACTDEAHQLFVDGRSGEWRDVMIDSSGVLLGCVLATLGFLVLRKLVRHYRAGRRMPAEQ